MRLRLFSTILVFVLMFSSFCCITTTHAGTVSDVEGYATLYKSSAKESVIANTPFGKSVITDTNADRSIFGHVLAQDAHECEFTIMINGDRSLAYTQEIKTIDWMYDSDSGLYSMPFVYEPAKVNITMRAFSIELTASESFPVFIWIGQKEADSSASESQLVRSSDVPKLGKVVPYSSTGYYFKTSITNWEDKAEGAQYQFCRKDGTVVDDGECYSGDSIISSTLDKQQVYYVRARFYAYDDNYNKVFSSWGQKRYFISSPELDPEGSEQTLRKNSVVIKWGKVIGAKKYEIYCSARPNSGYKKVGTTTKTSFKVTRLNGKKINFSDMKYFKVRAVTTISGKTVKSEPCEYMYLQCV